ncbi:MAG: hypothetical protein GY940_31495, partial [bacterium]|nr:hypothetical protein [bacterium]
MFSLKYKLIFPTIHFDLPNPLIDFQQSAVYVNDKLREWQVEDGKPRIAGVTSFGFSGTNCHIVLREAPPRHFTKESGNRHQDGGNYLITVSSRTPDGLRKNLHEILKKIEGKISYPLADISYTLNQGRKHFDYRFAGIVNRTADLKDQIREALSWAIPDNEPGKLSHR